MKCTNCRQIDGHATWCHHGPERMAAKIAKLPSIEAIDMLAEVVGLFGQRGWAEIKIVMPDDKTVRTCPLPESGYAIVQRARMLLRDRGKSPKSP